MDIEQANLELVLAQVEAVKAATEKTKAETRSIDDTNKRMESNRLGAVTKLQKLA